MSAPGSILSEVVTWVERITKQSSPATLDYINRFIMYDLPARLQLFELRRQFSFEALPNVYMYQIPFNPTIESLDPATTHEGIQILRPPVYCDGIQIGFTNTNYEFNNVFPEQVTNTTPIDGDGSANYTHTLVGFPFIPSFVDYLGQVIPYVIVSAESTGGTILYLVDDGNGTLKQMDSSFTDTIVSDAGTVNYTTGAFDFQFNTTIPSGNPIRFQIVNYSAGRPMMSLVYDNYIKLYPIPDKTYKIQFEAQLTPAQFLSTSAAVPFGYMAEYFARGAARKMLSDSGDVEQFNFYEPLFREQEVQVLRRTNRERATTRTPTIFSSYTDSFNYWRPL